MFDRLTLPRKIALSLASIALACILTGMVAVTSLHTLTVSKDRVLTVNVPRLAEVDEARVQRERRAKAVRSYVIARDDRYIHDMEEAKDKLLDHLDHLRATALGPEERRSIVAVDHANAVMQAEWDDLMAARKAGATAEDLIPRFTKGQPDVRKLDDEMGLLANEEQSLLNDARQAATDEGARASDWLIAMTVAATLLAAFLAITLARLLARQIGTALSRLQTSSTELEAAANQQVTSSQELSTTTNEISTTLKELLTTSRQIVASSQRVVQVAAETGGRAREGNRTVGTAQDAIGGIKRHVDLIVGHMVDLGHKSQQIGTILDLINELAEQTNILSINATIEAAGAGESGRRFSVVAQEIRRLAERVAGSAREIRTLVDEVRAAANTTIMATEGGAKAVDAGAGQFGDVLTSFKQIGERVDVTTEAAREIELSTTQQTIAVEQVSMAMGGVAQAATESASSSAQTLATAAQLLEVSKQLGLLIGNRSNGATRP